jgi:hypothetical protein
MRRRTFRRQPLRKLRDLVRGSTSACNVQCAANFTLCTDTMTCVNTRTDAQNCGTCHVACASGSSCSNGVCCATGQTNCNGTCADLKTNANNCGVCGTACGAGRSCSNGLCCPAGQANCGGTCVDLTINASECGACGTVCGAGAACSNGLCCPAGQANCNGTCVSLSSNGGNCGACGRVCGAGAACSTGVCCASGQTSCGGTCFNLQTNAANCGTCGHACAAGQACSAGQCVCTAASCGSGCCSGPSCIAAASESDMQCGGSSNGSCSACATGLHCMNGTCTCDCIAPSSAWTTGAIVAPGAVCPIGYSSNITALHSGVSVGCASGCGCSSPATGPCTMSLGMSLISQTDGNIASTFTVIAGMECTAAWPTFDATATTLTSNQPAHMRACNGTLPCPNCDPIGATAALPNWQSSFDFCPLASNAPACSGGKCAPSGTRVCLLASGNQACPAGFTAMGASGTWFTGATASSAACRCGGCGVASGESCDSVMMSVAYGVCTAPPLAAQFKGDGSSPSVSSDPTTTDWIAAELFPSISGIPTLGVCASSEPIPSGSYTPTGQQTLCCR